MGALLIFMALSGVAAPTHSATIYRCTLYGTTVYADHPCGDDAHQVKLPPTLTRAVRQHAPAPLPLVPATHEPKQKARSAPSTTARTGLNCPSEEAIHKAIRSHRVMLCLTPGEVRDAADITYNEYDVKTAVYGGVQYVQW
jgi:hypothetical protein